MPVELKPSSKKTLQNVLAEIGERKLVILGPNNEKLQDSRLAILDCAVDHVAIKLLGEGDALYLPYASITSVKIERQVVTIRYG